MKKLNKFDQAVIHFQQGAFELAKNLCAEVLRSNPDDSDAVNLLGLIAYRTNQLDLALDLYLKAIRINPVMAAYYSNLALVYQHLKQPEKALDNFNKAIALKSDFADAFYYRANLLLELKHYEPAISSYKRAIELNTTNTDVYFCLGSAQQMLGQFEEAIANYKKVTAENPRFFSALFNLGVIYHALKQLESAFFCFNQIITANSSNVEAYGNCGSILVDLNRYEEAHSYLDKAIQLNPNFAAAYLNKGHAYQKLRHLDQALVMYDKALELQPDYVAVINNRGVLFTDLHRFDDALVCFNRVIFLQPDYAEGYYNRGWVLLKSGQSEKAVQDFQKALALKPDYEFLHGLLLHTKMKLCDWFMLSESLKVIEANILNNQKASFPFPLLALVDNPALHKQASKIYSLSKHPEKNLKDDFKAPKLGEKIKVGYYSADFHAHATAFLMAELFEEHNKDKFEIYGFSFGPDLKDHMRERVSSSFSKFYDVRDMSDEAIANLSRELGMDIAIDLKGYTTDARPDVFALKCAPIQVNYLGYPGTMGVSYYDYVIADKIVIPLQNQSDYTEKVVYLPCSYQVNDSKRKISSKTFSREDQGLPESGFVFCCFNNNYKILPATFDLWMQILKEVDGSVFWLLEDNTTVVNNLRKEAEARGVDSSRLVFAKRVPLDEHLARHKLADLFLDTLPYNAHTTASDALWAGLPVLTQAGKSFASRVAASLLTYVDMPEMIVNSDAEYVEIAIQLARNPAQLKKLKTKLAKNKKTSSLFNGQQFARYIESAYSAMHARRAAGLLPEMIEIKPE